MTMIKKSITLTSQQEAWIKAQIASGHYGSDSEVVRDLIRREQNRHAEIETLRAALIRGEESGVSGRRPEEIMKAVEARLRENGQL